MLVLCALSNFWCIDPYRIQQVMGNLYIFDIVVVGVPAGIGNEMVVVIVMQGHRIIYRLGRVGLELVADLVRLGIEHNRQLRAFKNTHKPDHGIIIQRAQRRVIKGSVNHPYVDAVPSQLILGKNRINNCKSYLCRNCFRYVAFLAVRVAGRHEDNAEQCR